MSSNFHQPLLAVLNRNLEHDILYFLTSKFPTRLEIRTESRRKFEAREFLIVIYIRSYLMRNKIA